MESQVMVALGDFRFSMSTAAYQELERETSWRRPATDVIGARPQPQFIGKGEETIRLRGTVYPHFANAGLGQIDAMRAEADKGEPLKMVDGTGRIGAGGDHERSRRAVDVLVERRPTVSGLRRVPRVLRLGPAGVVERVARRALVTRGIKPRMNSTA